MSLRKATVFSSATNVPVYTRVLPGNGSDVDGRGRAATVATNQKRSKAHAKMGVGQGPTREHMMKALARNEPDSWYFTDYLLWWDSLRDSKMASDFVGDLIYFCVALQDTKQRKLRKTWFDKASKLTHDQTFALGRRAGKTIHYIACCYRVEASQHLTQALSDWHEAQKSLADKREKSSSSSDDHQTTVIDSPVILHSILLLERIIARTLPRDPALSSYPPLDPEQLAVHWRSTIIPRVIEGTFIGPEDSMVVKKKKLFLLLLLLLLLPLSSFFLCYPFGIFLFLFVAPFDNYYFCFFPFFHLFVFFFFFLSGTCIRWNTRWERRG